MDNQKHEQSFSINKQPPWKTKIVWNQLHVSFNINLIFLLKTFHLKIKLKQPININLSGDMGMVIHINYQEYIRPTAYFTKIGNNNN